MVYMNVFKLQSKILFYINYNNIYIFIFYIILYHFFYKYSKKNCYS